MAREAGSIYGKATFVTMRIKYKKYFRLFISFEVVVAE
jgi:hypothetical protein